MRISDWSSDVCSSDLGKTHLMHGIANQVRARDPGAKVAYLSAEKFMVEFLAALRAKDTISFKQKLRSVDVLMIDDVQFIAGKESTQDRKSVGKGKRESVRVDIGGRRIMTKKKK